MLKNTFSVLAGRQANPTMADLNNLSDRELRTKLAQYGMTDIPITQTTRDLVIRRLKSAMETAGNGTSSSHEHEEAATESRPSFARRKSVGAPAKPKTRQRASIAAPQSQFDSRTDDSDGHETEETIKKSSAKQNTPRIDKKSLNGKNKSFSNNASGTISDEELIRQLKLHKIVAQVITDSTRPILIKKLNHAVAKQKRESKSFSTPLPSYPDEEQDSAQESDKGYPDNSSFISAKERRSLTPSLSFSPQHSLTFGSNNSSYPSSDSFLKPRQSDFSRTFVPPSNPVINRFVEEQEPYDTGSDSENDSVPARKTPKKSWFPSWFGKKTDQNSTIPVKTSVFYANMKRKLNIVRQWQFVVVFLPLLAALFFLLLAAVYIKASYNETTPTQGDTAMDQAIQNVRNLIEKETITHLCGGDDAMAVDSSFLMEQLDMNQTMINKVLEAVTANPHWDVHVTGESWSTPIARLPIWCSIKTYLWNIAVAFFIIIFSFGVVLLIHQLVAANCRQREKEEQEVYSMVEMIIDLLARHQASMVVERRPHDAFLAVTHVRDVLIPLKERKSKMKLWNKAVQFLEDNESRVRPEIQQIEGEDFRVWRWLPPSTTFSPKKSTIHEDQTDDASAGSSFGPTNSVAPRPKVWQGQAFSTDSSGVNSPPPYPLTQCLKVRNMFDAEVEVGDSWPVRIQDAILEKADKGKIMHMAVDRGSREGCVYIKCASAEDAGKVYHSLHGWWFDGNLVTVKYLRPERYQYRFPDSAKATFPLQPSNDKRLSLQTKFWKSPLEHF